MSVISLPFTSLAEEEIETSKTYHIDWENGRIAGHVDGLEAMNQFVKKTLITPRFKCLIYDNQYGSEIRDNLIAPGVTREYFKAEINFFVEDALIHDERILRVYDLEVTFGESYPLHDTVTVSFSVDTVYGHISFKEVI